MVLEPYRLTFLFVVLGVCNTLTAQRVSFVAMKDGQTLCVRGDCTSQRSPCSTFKIALSLMGYDAGILISETKPLWDYKPGYVAWLDRWKQSHDPRLWMRNSCVWYSQAITQELGQAKFADYVQKFDYGNQDIIGDPDKNNGLTHCWLFSSLKISPREQVAFLSKLASKELPVSTEAQEFTHAIMFLEDLGDWKLYGKTGGGPNPARHNLQTGWFVGFLAKGNQLITFAYLLEDDKPERSFASLRAKAAAKEALKQILKKVP